MIGKASNDRHEKKLARWKSKVARYVATLLEDKEAEECMATKADPGGEENGGDEMTVKGSMEGYHAVMQGKKKKVEIVSTTPMAKRTTGSKRVKAQAAAASASQSAAPAASPGYQKVNTGSKRKRSAA